MAGGPRPRQPRFGGTSGSSSTQRGREQEPVETAGGAESPSSAGAETPRVRVNSRDKVAALDAANKIDVLDRLELGLPAPHHRAET